MKTNEARHQAVANNRIDCFFHIQFPPVHLMTIASHSMGETSCLRTLRGEKTKYIEGCIIAFSLQITICIFSCLTNHFHESYQSNKDYN